MFIKLFPEGFLELQQELMNDAHSEVWPLLAKYPPQEIELRLAEVASYCEILLDGAYDEEDLNKLCKILVKRLVEKRTGLILDAVPISKVLS